MGKKKLISILFIFYFLNISLSAQVTDSTKKEFDVKIIHSKILGEDRTIYVKLPQKYTARSRYPVLYLLDADLYFSMVSGQVERLSELSKIPPMIIVGIKNADRFKDLTPTHLMGSNGKDDTTSPLRNSGGADKFLQFLKQELCPYIAIHYYSSPYKIFSGHSLGGLLVIYTMITRLNLFNAYLAISPSLQWDNSIVLQKAFERPNTHIHNRNLLFICDANEDSFTFHHNIIMLDSLLKQMHFADLKFKYRQYPDETHFSVPTKAFNDGISYIFSIKQRHSLQQTK